MMETPQQAAHRLARREIAKGYVLQALHEYRNPDSTPAYWRIRCKHEDGSKWIRPMYLNGNGYELGQPQASATGRPLYRLPELQADSSAHVWIVEGENCADALARLQLVATTSGSASSAHAADWTPLRGRNVTLWPDNDAPGMQYAVDVADKLRALGCAVSVVDVAALNLAEHGDAVDWITPATTADDVRALPIQVTEQACAWPDPEPLPDALPPVAPFDADLLPQELRGWVMDIAERMQCPPDFTAVGAVVALSALVGARAVIAPKQKDNWRVTPNLWGAIIGRPGIMKSPALSQTMKPLQRLELDAREAWHAAHDEWALDCKVSELAAKANEKKAAGMAIKDPAKARELLAGAAVPEEPTRRRYVVNDSTQEKLADLLTVNPWGLLVYRDELHGLLRSMDKEGQEGARGFYLTGYDGDQGYAVDRIGRGESYVERVCLAMLGGIQPGKLQRYVRDAVNGGAGDDGLLQRFGMAVWPDVTGKWRKIDRWPDTAARQAAWAVFERLNKLQPANDNEPQTWQFTPEAQDLYWEWVEPFECELRGDELHPALVSHLAKYRKLIPALALLFALVDTPDAGVVGEQELLRALAWGDYLRSHAERIYAAAVVPETSGAETLLAKIRAGRLCDADGVLMDVFTPRQVAVKHWAGLATPDAVRKVAELLVEYGWLERELLATGGRPTERYLLHPMLTNGGAA